MVARDQAGVRIQTSLMPDDVELQDLLALWERQRGDRPLPSRADFTPEILRRHLGWLHLLDVRDGQPRFRFRLYGSEIAEVTGRDVTGRNFEDAFSGQFREALIRALEQTVRERRPLRVASTAAGANKDYIPITSLFLPLSEDGETVNMILIRHVFGAPTV